MTIRLYKRTAQSCRCEIGAQNLVVQTLKPMREMSRWKSRAREYSCSTLELLQLDVDPWRTGPIVWTVAATSFVVVLFGTFVLPKVLATIVVSPTLIAMIVAFLRSRRITTLLKVMVGTRW